jgi:signal transduction histidine kinase
MRSFILFFLFFTNAYFIFAQSVVSIHHDDTLFLAGSFAQVKPDAPRVLTIDDVMADSGFYPSTSERLLAGGDSSECYWLKFRIQNRTEEKAFLELMFPLIDTAVMYTVDSGRVIQRQEGGGNYSFSSRAFTANNIVFAINKSQQPLTYYINIKVRGFCSIKTRIGTYKAFIREYHHDDLIQGVFSGLILVFLCYNFFIFIQLKDSVYLLYCLYLFCISGYVFRHGGFIFQFIFPNTPQYNELAMLLTGLGGVFGALFTMKFLGTREHLPYIHRALQALFVIYCLDIIASIFGLAALSIALSRITMPMGTITVASAAVIMWRRGNPTAKFYLLGWVTLTLGLFTYLLEDVGVLPYNNLTAYALHLGIGLEATILSFAVANRFSLMKKDKEAALQGMYDALAENKMLLDERNKALEASVKERTSELNASAIKLQEYAQQLEKSNRELTEFAHIASHDLKAPIRGIVSFSQLFERKNKTTFDDIDREYFTYIKTNANQSVRLIDDLLNYSKIDKNLAPPTEIDLNQCLYVAKMNLRDSLQDRNVEIVCENLPTMLGHSLLFTQLLQNLIGNGIKYNKSCPPVIHISVNLSESKEYVFSVKDNGIGIAPQHQAKVFNMFLRLHGQSEYEGTGIGLAFCNRIVDTYGGRIWLESEVGVGSTFYFTLPKAQIEQHNP